MASSPSNENRPKLPGRCDICDLKDGKRGMNFVQCRICKVCVHRECYLVFPEGDGKDFVCFGCSSIGKTCQAVDTHRSTHFYEIEQKKRPTECALCSVSDGTHAMYPLFDYHGAGGRQICYTSKTNNKDGNVRGEKVLAWGHALCCLYLASVNFMYACYKDGDYIGMEEDEEEDPDRRPPNPELRITNEFRRMYGDAMPHFRYYMTPPDGKLDPWTKAVITNQKELKCIECGLLDHRNSMRIPLQCVANDPDEYFEHKDKHRLRNDDVRPCTQALHVGCARWKDKSTTVRKCFYFPGLTNSDGTIRENIDTVHCLYCKNHAENIDENFQKQLKKEKVMLLQKQKQQHRNQAKGFPKLPSLNTKNVRKRPPSPDATPLPSFSKRSVPNMSVTNYPTRNTKNASLTSLKGNKGKGKHKNKGKERHKELDPSIATPVNAGEQPKLGKRRREVANAMSVGVSKRDLNKIFEDLVNHEQEIVKNATMSLTGRRRFWKHKFLGLSTRDFDGIWHEAVEKIRNRNKNTDRNKPDMPPGKNDRGSTFVDSVNNTFDLTTYRGCGDSEINVERRSGLDPPGDEKAGTIDDGAKNQSSCKKKEKHKEIVQDRPPDRWANLFIGQRFEMGCEFTLDKFEENGVE
ncbi:unnamed protein product [Pseudo-nitzschia multistriata]|uniref:Zinc finger PHD-type domain-containing protein n=1 Tax=Pseudo-nitzschia multistriata TaxID=183589 RepID=A0A448Z986_9STRA|nr:unnamed protein product [Pseudo-nitzschia multistriata]